MAEHTLTVPAEYVEFFQLATGKEIADNAQWAVEQADEMSRWLLSDDIDKCLTADMSGPIRWLGASTTVMDQLCVAPAGAVAVHAKVDVLARIAEEMAIIVNSRLASELQVTPIGDADQVGDFSKLRKALNWAIDHAVELHGIYVAGIIAEKSA